VVSAAVQAGLAGLEMLVDVPGTIGGAVVGNAGGHGGDIGQRVRDVTVMLGDGTVEVRDRSRLAFESRWSNLDDCIVIACRLELDPDETNPTLFTMAPAQPTAVSSDAGGTAEGDLASAAALGGEMAAPRERVTDSGLRITDVVVGEGAEARSGQTVVVNYRGTLTNGKEFDSSYGRGPFSFPLGGGRVIAGWDEGVAGMRVGGKRRLVIPPDLAYGSRGAGGVIPPDATLIFEVELVRIGG
jgi:peptidylprolyl isomerase